MQGMSVIIRAKHYYYYYLQLVYVGRRSQWPRSLRRGSAVARLLGLQVRIPPEVWMFVCFECCVW